MTKPRIAIPVPTSFDLAYNAQSWPQYANAVDLAGGEPVRIELDTAPAEIARVANSCTGILLPGSPADLNPQKYGHALDPSTSPADPLRENVDELLLQDAHNLYKPILGICYGTQSLNVWRGGTLIQDLTILPVNHKAGRSVAVAHTVQLQTPSILFRNSAQYEVNSSHHQAIGIPGDGLRIVARCPLDGVIEAVEGGLSSIHFVLGVQWHPERNLEISAASRALFTRFVEECVRWSPREIQTSIAD